MSTAHRFVDREIETMSVAEVERLQLSRLNEFLQRGVWNNPFFQQRGYGPARELKSIEEFKQLPLMRKNDVMDDIRAQQPYGTRITCDLSEVRQVVETSGTSGSGRERYPLTEWDLEYVQQQEMPGFRWAGIEAGKIFVASLPVTTRAGGQWYQDAVRRLGGIWLSVGTYTAEEKLRYMQEVGVDVMHASASYLVRMEVVCAAAGVDPRSLGIKAIMTAGEPFAAHWLAEREAIWGAPIHEQYGSTQRAIAWTCENGALVDGHLGVLHTLPHCAVYEVIDPETGEEVGPGEAGELIITPFGSTAAPIVRFASGDRVIKVDITECSCGRPFHGVRSGSIDRFDMMMKVRGVNVIPSNVDEVLLQHPVTDYQARVYRDEATGREEMEMVVASAQTLTDADLAALADRFRAHFGLRCTMIAHGGPNIVDDTKIDVKKRKRWTDERVSKV